eukprot:358487-Chlamydomonas_euryale.AAC.14
MQTGRRATSLNPPSAPAAKRPQIRATNPRNHPFARITRNKNPFILCWPGACSGRNIHSRDRNWGRSGVSKHPNSLPQVASFSRPAYKLARSIVAAAATRLGRPHASPHRFCAFLFHSLVSPSRVSMCGESRPSTRMLASSRTLHPKVAISWHQGPQS